jgi:transglutaminase-like putative cysteine protease
MIDRANTITGPWTNSLTASLAIYDWVYKTVQKAPTVSLPSALDVLLKPEGDCNEHTYLFVALARAAGIPAKIRVGLTLQNGMFYYHAWPSVYVGRWLDMDPTLNYKAVGADHISLFEGELAEQMKLMGVVGRLKVEITEIKN